MAGFENNQAIIQAARKFINESNLNRLEELGGIRIFQEPVVHFADAQDPMFVTLQDPQVIRPEHLLPADWLPGASTVISYFLPFTEEVRRANYPEGLPAVEWVYGRIEGEECNQAFRRELIREINQIGGQAMAPALDSRYAVKDNKSNWSERHVAFIAGLGTFGLNKTIITEKGCAGRFGSVITDLKLAIDQRPYEDIYEYCSWCYQCVDRCPSQAIREEGKDIPTCSNYIDTQVLPKFAPRYGCGKCQTHVLCEDSRP